MTKQDIRIALKAKPENGWELISFTDSKNKSFYTWVLENHDIPFAWIAVVQKINRKQIQKHFFKRKDVLRGEPAPGQPRLLMVTTGRSWLVADMQMESFSYFEPLSLEGLLAAEVKLYVENKDRHHLNYLQEEAFTAFLNDYTLRVNKNWDEVRYTREFAFLDGMELDLKVPNEIENKMEVLEAKMKMQEKNLHDAKTQLFDNSIIFHYLFSKCFPAQIKKVLELATPRCYLNLWYKPGESILLKNIYSPNDQIQDNKEAREFWEVFVNGKAYRRNGDLEEREGEKAGFFFRFEKRHWELITNL